MITGTLTIMGVWTKALLGTFVGRAIAVALGALVLWRANNYVVGKKAIRKHVERSDNTAKRIGQNARSAHARANRGDASKRLWSEYKWR
jgi:uncharacterized membrane protein YfbV (UPF0208 family)